MSAEEELRARLDELVTAAREKGLDGQLSGWLSAALASAPVPAQEGPIGRFGMVGQSPAMEPVYDLIDRVADVDVPVLIQGETGTGKELVARALHDTSARAKRTFMAVNCAAVPANLLESELFGHVRGAFTGAVADRKGQFVEADSGTLFLDEIGDMPLEMQAKLLRVLQEGEVRPVGGSKVVKVDVRVVAASHRDLGQMCADGAFREDLYFRLNVVKIELPPLRQRGSDIALLARSLAPGLAAEIGCPAPVFSDEAIRALEAWRWPGNVRELQNELRRAIALGGNPLQASDFSTHVSQALQEH